MPPAAPLSARPYAGLDPLAVAELFLDDPLVLLFDSADRQRGRYSYLCVEPSQILRSDSEVRPFFDALAQNLGPTRPALPHLPPFQGGLAGLWGYDLARQLERLPAPVQRDHGWPDAVVARFDAVIAWDHHQGAAWIVGEPAAVERLAARLAAAPAPALSPLDWSVRGEFVAEQQPSAYQRKVAQVIDWIYAGDIFQANLSQRFAAQRPSGLSGWMLYRRLRSLSAAPYASFLQWQGQAILSASPEQFLQVSPEGLVETRPIKGTRPRGETPQQDQDFAEALLQSAKDHAENLMIVDLLRNDIARVCRPGSVSVPSLCALETHPTVHHLVSTIRGQLAAGRSALDLLKAAFPGGSITGAPKIRAMEIIAALEAQSRGPYCGTIGWMGWNGAMDSNILIRTMVMTSDRVLAQAGGGIVADSDPRAEYQETLTKARAMLASLEGPPCDFC